MLPRDEELMSDHPSIATCTLLAIEPNGTEVHLELGLGQPYEVTHDEWACPVKLTGLYTHLHAQHGQDSWQSMQLAYQLVARLLAEFIEKGGVLYWPDSREPVKIQELIPQLSPNGSS
jgi:hypothetical protein